MLRFILFVLILMQIGCKSSSAFTVNPRVIEKSDFAPCEDDALTKFDWAWCDSISDSSSNVSEVCVGTVVYTDMGYSALQIKIKDGDKDKYECLFAANWTDIARDNCTSAALREYMTVYGEPKKTNIIECYNDNVVIQLEGNSISGQHFIAVKP